MLSSKPKNPISHWPGMRKSSSKSPASSPPRAERRLRCPDRAGCAAARRRRSRAATTRDTARRLAGRASDTTRDRALDAFEHAGQAGRIRRGAGGVHLQERGDVRELARGDVVVSVGDRHARSFESDRRCTVEERCMSELTSSSFATSPASNRFGNAAALSSGLPVELRVPHLDEELQRSTGVTSAGFRDVSRARGRRRRRLRGGQRFDASTLEIKRLYVEPAFRGSGAGRALMEAAIAFARERSLGRVVLDTQRERLRAAYELYRRSVSCRVLRMRRPSTRTRRTWNCG